MQTVKKHSLLKFSDKNLFENWTVANTGNNFQHFL